MNAQIKASAEQYNDGLISPDELLANIINSVGERWKELKAANEDAFREYPDVAHLANILTQL